MSSILTAIAEGAGLLLAGAADVWQVIGLSLRVSTAAVLIAVVFGLPIGYLLGIGLFRGRRAMVLLTILMVNTGMGLPPVVVGLVIYMLLSRSGPLGPLGLLFTPTAMVIAQVVIATPLVIGVSTAAFAAVPRELRLQARSLGAGRLAEAWLTVKEARKGVMAAVVAGFGGIISEVGAVMLVGGNVSGQTRVMTTAIVLETRKGEFGTALALGLTLVGIAFVINGLLTMLQLSGGRDER